jgi:hypothetical protein
VKRMRKVIVSQCNTHVTLRNCETLVRGKKDAQNEREPGQTARHRAAA